MATSSKGYSTYLRHLWNYCLITFCLCVCLCTLYTKACFCTYALDCMLTLLCWLAAPHDGNHFIRNASQHTELLGHKKEHNAPKLHKAQCSFCCYSETHPSLTETHICTIINKCERSLYRKHTLFQYWFIIEFS